MTEADFERYESTEVTSGFVLASPQGEYGGGDEQYSGELDIHFVDQEGSWAGHLMVLGIVRFFKGMKHFFLIAPKGTFSDPDPFE